MEYSKKVKNLLNKAKENVLLSIEIYNKPATSFRSGGFIVLMNIAWTSLFHAIFEKDGIKYFRKDTKYKNRYLKIDGDYKTWELSYCVDKYFKGQSNPISTNIKFLSMIRDKIEHRFIPELDIEIFGELQATLYNFEEILIKEFGGKHTIAENLVFSLQFSRVQHKNQIKAKAKLQSKEFTLLKNYINTFRQSIPCEIRYDPSYAFKVFLIPKVGNHPGSSDVCIDFIKYDPLNIDDMDKYDRVVALIKEKHIPIITENIPNIITINETKDGLVDSSSKDNEKTTALIGITTDPKKASGIFYTKEISDDLFKEITNVVKATKLLNKSTGEYPLRKRISYRIYAEREKIPKDNENYRMFLNGFYHDYMPTMFWLLNLKKEEIITFLLENFDSQKCRKTMITLRLLFFLNEDIRNGVLDLLLNKYKNHPQPPGWFFTYKEMMKQNKKTSLISSALNIGQASVVVEENLFDESRWTMKMLIDDNKQAKVILDNICMKISQGAEGLEPIARNLDYIVYHDKFTKYMASTKPESILGSIKKHLETSTINSISNTANIPEDI